MSTPPPPPIFEDIGLVMGKSQALIFSWSQVSPAQALVKVTLKSFGIFTVVLL